MDQVKALFTNLAGQYSLRVDMSNRLIYQVSQGVDVGWHDQGACISSV